MSIQRNNTELEIFQTKIDETSITKSSTQLGLCEASSDKDTHDFRQIQQQEESSHSRREYEQ